MDNVKLMIKDLLLSKEYNLQFFGDILMQLKIKESKTVNIAGVTVDDGIVLLINEESFRKLNYNQQKYVLTHEVLHLILNHCTRGIEYHNLGINPKIINVAADLATNSLLGRPPLSGCYPGEFPFESLERGLSFEKYLSLLLKNPEKANETNGFDDHDNWKKIKEEEMEVNKLMKDLRILKERYAGKLSKDLEEALTIEKKIINWNWKYRIKSWVARNLSEKFVETKTRPNRRFPKLVGIVPGKKREPEGKVFIFVDTSGSIDKYLLKQFFSLAISIPAEKEIYMIDTEIKGKPIKANKGIFAKEIVAKGRGGTDFRPAFELAKQKRAKLVVYFTDLCGNFPETDPGIPTVWIAPEKEKVPFGEVIEIKIWEGL